MNDLRQAAQQALEALGKWSTGRDMDAVELNDLIATLEAALEQQEQEQMLECAYKSACDIVEEQDKKLAELEAANQERLGALKAVCTHAPRSSQQIEADWNKARAAIAKAEAQS